MNIHMTKYLDYTYILYAIELTVNLCMNSVGNGRLPQMLWIGLYEKIEWKPLYSNDNKKFCSIHLCAM